MKVRNHNPTRASNRFSKHTEGIGKKVPKIARRTLQKKSGKLGEGHKQATDRSSVKKKSGNKNKNYRQTDHTVVAFIKQDRKSNPADDAKEKVLQKNNHSKGSALFAFSIRFQERKADLLELFGGRTAVVRAEENSCYAKEIIEKTCAKAENRAV